MKERTVYCVQLGTSYGSEYQYFLPSEFHLLKTLLKDGRKILTVSIEKVTPERYKFLFG